MYEDTSVLSGAMLCVFAIIAGAENIYRALEACRKCAEACRKHHASVRNRVVILRKRVLG